MRFFLFQIMSVVLFFQSTLWAQTEPAPFSEKHVYPFLERAIDQNSQFIIASGAVSVFIVNPQDDEIRSKWKDHQKMSKDAAYAGDIMGSGAVGLLALGGQYYFDQDHDQWISHARALVWSTVFSSAMKFSFGRPRPGRSDDHHSFPSGHTTIAFTTATSLTYAYGWKAAAVAYPIATFVGLARLSDDVHWGSDVVAGAFLGFWAARASYYSTHEIEDAQMKSVFSPVISPDELGLRWSYSY
jgi:hypothetical protein